MGRANTRGEKAAAMHGRTSPNVYTWVAISYTAMRCLLTWSWFRYATGLACPTLGEYVDGELGMY